MAVDSIIARPTNSVRVMVAEASGCWASEVRAVATALPSASAGPMVPKPVVIPPMMIEATAIVVKLSILGSFCAHGFADLGSGRDINGRQNTEDVGLNHTDEQSEHGHEDGEDVGRNRE